MMRIPNLIIIIASAICFVNCTSSQQLKNDKNEFKGRIAWSADGNFNDEDDWAASPVALAIFSGFGVKDKLVHFDYNNILPKTNEEWEKIHEASVLGAADRYGYSKSIFHNVRKDKDAAVNSIANAINASSEENPLYFVLAGPMEIPVLGIQKADPEKRKFVTCISHNIWNDGYMSGDLVELNKRDVIPLGVNWVQITDQNQFLTTSPFGRPAKEEEWQPWLWMRDSKDANVRFLWERMRVSTRADCSDAGMAYFLMTGDEKTGVGKLKNLIENNIVPKPLESRTVRLEAENFKDLQGFEVEYIKERAASQMMSVRYSGNSNGEISTEFREVHLFQASNYDIDVRIFSGSGSDAEYSLSVNDELKDKWSASKLNSWESKTIKNVAVKIGDELSIKVSKGLLGIKLDYIELRDRVQENPFTRTITGTLDDPDALPGQIIIAGGHPGYLKYNGIPGPAYWSGPDNPETFLYDDIPYNTKRDSGQVEMIKLMEEANVTGFHFLIWRMKMGNMKGEGSDTQSPFVDHDPSRGLDQNVLDRWEAYLDLFEEAGIVVHLELYNDATDVELIGWTLDGEGNLHPDEHRFVTGIVEKFKHHKNIIWGIEESSNKPPKSRVPHFKKIAEVIAETDNYNHPTHLGFVVIDDPEGDDPEDAATPEDYRNDPNIGIVSWLHVHPHGDDFEAQYQEYLKYYLQDSAHFIVMTNETYRHPTNGSPSSRKYAWAVAMSKMHNLNAYHYANKPRHQSHLLEDGYIASFMERTDFHTMQPRNDLAAGSAKWVMANPGASYILYTYDYQGNMGIKDLPSGWYDLLWLDTETGETVKQHISRRIEAGETTWNKPESFGNEVALYAQKRY